MKRLNDRAFDILQTEIRRCTSSDMSGQVQYELALRRLQKFRLQQGSPLTYAELKEALFDLLPNLDDRVVRKAAKANRPPSMVWFWLKTGTLTVGVLAGGIWLVNRPIPWVRYLVAQNAPFLLTPSYMAMDYHYKNAIALVQQTDQLINRATAFEDLGLGEQKVKAAQKHLDELPAWYFGHFPSEYCWMMGCGWRFTFDEFRQARESVARVEARLFQEKNAQTRFEQADQALSEAMHLVQSQASEKERNKAIAQWQSAMDTLDQLPPELLAGRLARGKLAAAERDFKQVVGFEADSQRTGRLIEAARLSAIAATQPANQPLSVTELEQIRDLWKDAIAQLDQIQVDDPDYVESRRRLIEYRKGLSQVSDRILKEKASIQAFNQAKLLTDQLLIAGDPKLVDRRYVVAKLEAIVSELQAVQPGTTVYADAQQLRKSAENRLR